MSPSKPPIKTEEFALENFLPYRLSLLSNTISEGIAISYRKAHNLSVTEWRVIAVLGRFPGQTASEVVKRTAMDKVTVSRAVKKLLEKDLIERNALEEDRRRQPLKLTRQKGWRLYRKIVPKALAYEAELLAALTSPERKSLGVMVSKLQAMAESLKPED
jgi:DNA-binding MarR family transcriptional regulator